VQLTVRIPRWVMTGLAILVASVGMAALLPAIASSDSVVTYNACIDPMTQDITFDSSCTGTAITWNQTGPAGADGAAGQDGAPGPAGPAGPAGAVAHLDKSKPALVAKILTTLAVQNSVASDVNSNIRAGLAASKKLTVAPTTDPVVGALQTQLALQGASIERLVNVLRALSKAQALLVQGLE
jgi:hypothetical protein